MGDVSGQEDLAGIPDDVRFDYQGQCWWCGNLADSREHKYKRSDIVREFGRGPWTEPMLRVAGGNRQFRVQGPNSQGLKFGKSLCQRCNNDRSQPFDLAYDLMMDYVSRNESGIVSRGFFKQSDIYGEDWSDGRDNTLRYLVKHISCRMAEDGVKVPSSFVGFLNKAVPEPLGLSLELSINLDIMAMEEHLASAHGLDPGSVWLGDASCEYSASRRVVTYVGSHVGVGPIWFSYEVFVDEPRYSTNLSRNKVRVPTFRNLAPTAFQEQCRECRGGSNPPQSG